MISKIKKQAFNTFMKESEPGASGSHAELVSQIFHCRDLVHLAHLKSTSYAEHMALGDLYEGLGDLADDICELIQGYTGILNITLKGCTCVPVLPYLKTEQKEFIQKVKQYNEMPDVQNKLQDVLTLITKTIYKLENLH